MLLVGPLIHTIAGLLTFMADESTTESTQTTTAKESTSTTSSADGQQAADSTTGAATQTAQTTEASGKTDTAQAETKIDENSPEFKAALTKAIQAKLPQLQKQARKDVARELSGEKEGEPTVEDLKKLNADKDARLRTFEARDQLETFVSDKRNQIHVNNFRGVFKLIKDDLKFDDEGNVTNFKDVLAAAKLDAPEMFRGSSSSIDAGNGARQQPVMDMNALIRGR